MRLTAAIAGLFASVLLHGCESSSRIMPPDQPIPAEIAIFSEDLNWYIEKMPLCEDTVEAVFVDQENEFGVPRIMISLTEPGKAWLAEYSARHVGSRMDVIVNDEVVFAPIIAEPITQGALQITGPLGDLTEVGSAFLSPCDQAITGEQ